MIVVRSRNKHAYLEALHKADMNVGTAPSDGANATLAQIRPFQKYMTDLIISEIEGNTLFATEKSEDIWWYDGERVQFRTPNYGKILRELQVEPNSTYASLQGITGISISALQKLMQSLVDKDYIEKSDKNGWRVFITPSM
jgi:predicted HTH transcriptional regulator